MTSLPSPALCRGEGQNGNNTDSMFQAAQLLKPKSVCDCSFISVIIVSSRGHSGFFLSCYSKMVAPSWQLAAPQGCLLLCFSLLFPCPLESSVFFHFFFKNFCQSDIRKCDLSLVLFAFQTT